MTKLYFSKNPDQRLMPGQEMDLPDWSAHNKSEQYVIDNEGLVAALNAAILLGQPLLLTGEPGTGKTTLAARVAWQLGLEDPLTFETKSNSVARDLFYTFDAVGRFQAANAKAEKTDNLDFITFQALGKAIILTSSPDDPLHQKVHAFEHAKKAATTGVPPALSRRSVVLIDEIDKAHRDFPNDLLNEIDRMFFMIPECGNQRIGVNPKFRPIVIITSNSEKNLPEPFLRRCVYHHIEFPSPAALEKILRLRLGIPRPDDQATATPSPGSGSAVPVASAAGSRDLIQSAVSFFMELRELHLRKNPATAELIGWTRLLLAYGAKATEPLSKIKHFVELTLSALAKNQDDLAEVRSHLQSSVELKRVVVDGAK